MSARDICGSGGGCGLQAISGDRRYVASLARDEFPAARRAISELAAVESFDEWLDEQEGSWIGLAHAGVETIAVELAVSNYLAWCAMTARTPGLATLDEFAALVGRYRESPGAPCRAAVTTTEGVDGRKAPIADAATGSSVAAQAPAAAHVVEISGAWLMEWCRCCRRDFDVAAADDYAALWIEHLAA